MIIILAYYYNKKKKKVVMITTITITVLGDRRRPSYVVARVRKTSWPAGNGMRRGRVRNFGFRGPSQAQFWGGFPSLGTPMRAQD